MVIIFISTFMPLKVFATDYGFFSSNDILFYDPADTCGGGTSATTPTGASNGNIVAIGDSIMVGLIDVGFKGKLKTAGYTDATLDGVGSRSLISPGVGPSSGTGIQAVTAHKDKVQAAGTVLVEIGTNADNTFDTTLPKMIKTIRDINPTTRILWSNVGTTSSAGASNMVSANKIIDKYSSTLHYTVIDWANVIQAHPDYLSGDGTHPDTNGYNKMAEFEISKLGKAGAGSTGSRGASTLDQVKTFASEPITSTWNISNSTAEQWFLKQAGAQATKAKFGLNSSNIGRITSAVEAANVSPVFFYLYTVNEGGGAGGFINHYGSDISGGGPANAKRDAEYLASQSKDKSAGPATGGGEPSDMPTAEARQILSSLHSGSIGVVYIQATSAVTAELEDLSGKTGGWSGLFGKPLSDAMQNIKTMGGDPQQGGSTSTSTGDCTGTGGVTGQGIASAVSWAVMIAKNNGYGYDQPTRQTGWEKYQSDPNCASQCGSFDCTSFISAVLTAAGYFKTNPNFAGNEASELEGVGFKQVATSATTSANLQPGDILIAANHTEMYIGNNQNVGAHINENDGVSGGQVGDQTGNEISVKPFYDDNWIGVFRAPN